MFAQGRDARKWGESPRAWSTTPARRPRGTLPGAKAGKGLWPPGPGPSKDKPNPESWGDLPRGRPGRTADNVRAAS